MNAIPAEDLERLGLAALDDLVTKGDVHVTRNSRPRYVVLSVERYQELLADADEAYLTRLRASLEYMKTSR